MNNIIAFDRKTAPLIHTAVKNMTGNIISFVDWKAAPHPFRTPNGVFFTTQNWFFSGDAA